MSPDPARRPLAGTRGVLPGTDLLEALRTLRGELGAPHVGALPELPARGFAATTTARTVTVLDGLHADGQAFGWRLVSRPSRESRLAESAWRSDLNLLADVVGAEGPGHRGTTQLTLLGPLTLAARLRLPNGEPVLSDHGARRDLADALVSGAEQAVRGLRTATEGEPLVLRWAEPDLEAVLAGTVPTSSGYRTLRAVPREEAVRVLTALAERTRSLGAEGLADPQSEALPSPAASEALEAFDGLALRPAPTLEHGHGRDWEEIARILEEGRSVRLGTVAADPRAGAPAQVERLSVLWRRLGLGPAALDRVVVEEREDLAAGSPAEARRVLARSAAVAEGLLETSRDESG